MEKIEAREPNYKFYFLKEEREKSENITKESYEDMVKNYQSLKITKDLCKTK